MRPARTAGAATAGSTGGRPRRVPVPRVAAPERHRRPRRLRGRGCVVFALGFNDVYGLHGCGSTRTWRRCRRHTVANPTADLDDGDQVTVRVEGAWHGHGRNFHSGAFLGRASPPGSTRRATRPISVSRSRYPSTVRDAGPTTMTIKSTVLSTAGAADCVQPPGCVIGVQVPAGSGTGCRGRSSRSRSRLRWAAAARRSCAASDDRPAQALRRRAVGHRHHDPGTEAPPSASAARCPTPTRCTPMCRGGRDGDRHDHAASVHRRTDSQPDPQQADRLRRARALRPLPVQHAGTGTGPDVWSAPVRPPVLSATL